MYRYLAPILGLALLGACTERNPLSTDSGPPSTDGGAPPTADGGDWACIDNTGCSATQYCHHEGCGGVGECRPRPEACQEDCPGVCGCDNQTYCNACKAHAAGVNVATSAPCEQPGSPTCASNADCAANAYCHLDGACPGPTSMGVCVPRPTICPDYNTCPWACGCDGKSYCSACEAQQAGVNVEQQGPCMSCNELDTAYQAEVQAAKQCCPMCAALQCIQQVPDRLACGCPTYVNSSPTARMKQLQHQWALQSCMAKIKCAPSQCGSLFSGLCADDGTCKDVYAD